MEELIKAMSNADLAELKTKHANNESVTALIDGILEARAKEAEQAKALKKFEAGIAKLFSDLPHPDGIQNVYAGWREVEEEVPNSEAVEVDIPNADGKGTHKEMRKPKQNVYKWVVETNKAITIRSGGGNGSTTSKRAITVSKRSEANPSQLELVGHFRSGKEATDHLKIAVGGDSANRALQREGYFFEPYEGTEYTMNKS